MGDHVVMPHNASELGHAEDGHEEQRRAQRKLDDRLPTFATRT
jgi:hypothetical protein